jgi:hypothetical protein
MVLDQMLFGFEKKPRGTAFRNIPRTQVVSATRTPSPDTCPRDDLLSRCAMYEKRWYGLGLAAG